MINNAINIDYTFDVLFRDITNIDNKFGRIKMFIPKTLSCIKEL